SSWRSTSSSPPPSSAKRGARSRLVAKRALPRPPLPPRATSSASPSPRSSPIGSGLPARRATVPTGTSTRTVSASAPWRRPAPPRAHPQADLVNEHGVPRRPRSGLGCGGFPGQRPHAHALAVLAKVLEHHVPGGQGEDRVVARQAHVLARVDARAALAHDDR